jgi:hypothetical protein
MEARGFGMTHMTHPDSRHDIRPRRFRTDDLVSQAQHCHLKVSPNPLYHDVVAVVVLGRSGPRILS